jgi:hypothetical protein
MGEMKKFVFIDESIRDQYTIAAVIVPITKVGEYRREMLKLRPKGSNAFHMGSEKKNSRVRAVEALAKLQYLELLVAKVAGMNQKEARQVALKTLLKNLESHNFNIVLDRTNQEFSDRSTLFHARAEMDGEVNFLHSNRYLEAGLWGADVLAWSVGTHLGQKLSYRDAD